MLIRAFFLLFLLCLYPGIIFADRTTTICASGCDQTSIADWLTNVVPATLTQIEIADIQGSITETVTIGTGKTTSSSNYLKITSSYNKNLGNWKDGNGYAITGTLTLSANYTQVEWVEIVGRIAGSNNITPITISQNIIHGVNADLISTGSNTTTTIKNCVLYNNSGASNFKAAVHCGTGGPGTCNVYNSTAFNIRYVAFWKDSATMNVVNSYAGTCGTQGSGSCFDVTTTNSGYNISSDTSATTNCTLGSCVNSKAASAQFKSTTTGSENFNLLQTADIKGVGSDLSATFTIDVVNSTRNVPWDIGAYKYVPTGLLKHGGNVNYGGTVNF